MAAITPSTPTPRRSTRFTGCSSILDYEVIAKLGEGTFGEVHKARSRATGKVVALKKILMHNEKDGFPITALREVKLLKTLCHVNILKLEEMAIERAKTKERKKAIMYMVTPYMDHDLSGLLDNPDVTMKEPQIKCYMLQLLEGLRYLHSAHILHRDMKAANLLINNDGLLQIADFGLARYFDEPSPKPGKGGGEARRDYTALVVTRWYRPPELLLGLRKYTSAIDLWGVGCVFGEMFKKQPILCGKSDVAQAHMIFDLVGSPNDKNMPGWSDLPGCEGTKSFDFKVGNIFEQFKELSPEAMSLLRDLLTLDWRTRINAYDALRHPYFTTEPLPARPSDLPRYNDSHELDRRRVRDHKAAAPPPAPVGGAVGMGPEGEWASQNGSGPSHDYRRESGRNIDHRERMPPRWDDGRAPHTRPPPAYDSRRPTHAGGPPPSYPDRRPGWSRQPPDSLPPRPQHDGIPTRPPHNRDHVQSYPNDRVPRGGADGPPRLRDGGPAVDKYIPQYASAGAHDREIDRERDRRDYRERDHPPRPGPGGRPYPHDYDRPPPRRYDDRDRDRGPDRIHRGSSGYYDRDRRDGGNGVGGAGLSYDDDLIDKDRMRYNERDRDWEQDHNRRRTRSRSPVRDRRDQGHARDRDRDREKDRNPYGRR